MFALKVFCRFYNVMLLLGFKHVRGSGTSSCIPLCVFPISTEHLYTCTVYLYFKHNNVHSVIKYS